MIYSPAEDSEFLAGFVKNIARGRVLDIGCGSGIQSSTASSKKEVTSVLGVDIDKESVSYCKKNIVSPKVSFLVSDIFSNVKGTFDTIVCNPPYLPQDEGIDDIALYGGKQGQEFAERIIVEAGDYLTEKGQIIILTSSLSNEKQFLETCAKNLYDSKLLGIKNMGLFETLHAWMITKNIVRKTLEKKKISAIHFFAKGKRGFVLKGIYKKKVVAIKVKNPDSFALGSVENESRMLKIVNKKSIGPTFLFSGVGFVVYEFVEGTFLRDVIYSCTKKVKNAIVQQLFKQCKILDGIGVEKGELARPLKNAIIAKKGKLVLIDFERARMRENPKNTRQVLQFIARIGMITKETAIGRGKALK